MEFTRHGLKKAMYILQSMLGLSWVIMSLFMFFKPGANLLADTLPACVLLFAGTVCIFFGVEAFLLRKDPEIWK